MKNKQQGTLSLAKRNYLRFVANRMAVVSTVVLVIMVVACVFAPLLTPYDPSYLDIANRSLPCSWEHPLGTDRVGRDIFARILYGGRVSMLIGLASALGSTLLGTALGCIAGYKGGKVDKVLLVVQEFFCIVPTTLLIMLCVGFLGQSIVNIVIIFTLTGWAGIMRVVRGNVLALKQEPFVESCRANGISGFSIMFHHLLPNTVGPIVVNTTLAISGYILAETGLSYLGLGVPDTTPTWGNIINAARRLDIIQTEPMLWLAPGIAICLFVLCTNFFGDGLRDALDPTSR